MEFTRAERIFLKKNPDFSEDWVQRRIADDPAILGLGDLELLDRERRQPRAGCLDLLLRDPDSLRRYEVEVQLGATDESHIIRTIEYWDIERKRYPNVEHCAVIVAEDITSRFLNVISLFNGHIPLIAIKMEAINVREYLILNFTTVLDELELGGIGEIEEQNATPTDRTYWEAKASPQMLALTDKLLEIVRKIEPTAELRYNKHYIGLTVRRRAFNFIEIKPKQQFVKVEFALPKTTEVDSIIEEAGLDALPYDRTWQHYRIRVRHSEFEDSASTIERLMTLAHKRRTGDETDTSTIDDG